MPKRSQRGFVIIDAVSGLALVAMLLGVMTTVVIRHHQASRKLTVQRELTAIAEATLLEMQSAGAAAADAAVAAGGDAGAADAPAEAQVTITRLESALPGKGMAWAAVEVTIDQQQARVVGLVPVDALDAAATATAAKTAAATAAPAASDRAEGLP